MIREISLNCMDQLTDNIYADGKVVITKAGSPLGALVNNTTVGSSTDPTVHDAMIDKLVNLLSSSVNKQLSYLRNEVIPFVNETSDVLKENIHDKILGSKPFFNTRITYFSIPSVLNTSYIKNLINSNKGFGGEQPKNFIMHNPITVDAWKELVSTGELAVDDKIQQWFITATTERPEIVSDVWYSFFCSQDPGKADFEYFITDNKASILARLHILTGLLLTADAMSKEVCDKAVAGVDRALYLETARQWVQFASFHLDKLLNTYGKVRKDGLILDYNKSSDSMLLNKDVFDKYLKDGGTMEALFGFIYTRLDQDKTVYSNAQVILDNSEQYLQAYAKAIRLNEVINKTNALSVFKRRLVLLVSTSISATNDTISEAEKALKKSNPEHITTVMDKLDDYLKQVSLVDIETKEALEVTVLKAVTLSKYYFTPAFTMLTGANTLLAAKDTTITDTKEAILSVTIDYVLKHLFSQCDIIPG